ncbi:cyclase family protein [Streptomyces sp. NPDC090075]|uniref:cyclase family protein n=1 Tax=Streptomyces sp. NPDC090075 TaxID=3365937 RepID=UPI0038003443
MTTSDRGTVRRNWGRWGADDQRGALNLLTPEVVRSAAASVTRGRVYGLGMPVRAEGMPNLPGRAPMRLTMRDGTDADAYAKWGCAAGTGSHEDALVMSTHATSHMDALVHVYAEHRHYNGVGHDTMRAEAGAQRLGIENVGGLAARGVLLDMVRHLDAGEHLEPGRAIGAADLAAAAEAQGVEVRAGDAVLIRTGYLQFLIRNLAEGRPQPPEIPGIDAGAARWLVERDVVAVGSDNAAVEVLPFAEGDFLRVHKMLLVDSGIYLLEFLDLSAPAADEAWEGLLTVGPLKITGGTGSPINPVYVS